MEMEKIDFALPGVVVVLAVALFFPVETLIMTGLLLALSAIQDI